MDELMLVYCGDSTDAHSSICLSVRPSARLPFYLVIFFLIVFLFSKNPGRRDALTTPEMIAVIYLSRCFLCCEYR